MGCSQGSSAKLLVEPGSSAHTFDASSEIYDFLYESIQKKGRIVGGRSIFGSRSNYISPTRQGHAEVGGDLATYTNAADLNLWLPRVLGAAKATFVFDIADTLPAFGMLIDRVGGIFQYTDCTVNRCMWRGKAGPGDSEPEMIEQVLNIWALGETLGTSWPGSAPTMSVAANRASYIMSDSVLTVASTPYPFKAFVLLVDNHLQRRWVNSVNATALCPGDRTVMLRVLMPFTAATAAVFTGIYQNAARLTGASATLVFTPTGAGAGVSTSFALEKLQWGQTSPVVRGKTEIDLQVDFLVRKAAVATSEIIATSDSVI